MSTAWGGVFTDPEQAREYPGFAYQGEYRGTLYPDDPEKRTEAGLQVAVIGENRFRARSYQGGLPGEPGWSDEGARELEGKLEDHVLVLKGTEGDLRFRHVLNRFTALDESNRYRGHLEPVRRESSSLGMEPPAEAIVLFDGTGLDRWTGTAEMTDDGLLREGATTADAYGDIRLHVEARLPFMPEAPGQSRANSGIYLQNRYEVQILDSFAQAAKVNGNASLYRESSPLVNASYPPLTWQTYDVWFRAPRFDEGGNKTENARVTAYLNGALVQDDVELEKGTGRGGTREEIPEGQLYLQDHGDPVRFQHIWLVEEEYAPPGTDRLEVEAPE